MVVRLLQRLGLRREGHFLQNVWFKGKWGDEFLYAVLHGEWMSSGRFRNDEEPRGRVVAEPGGLPSGSPPFGRVVSTPPGGSDGRRSCRRWPAKSRPRTGG